VEAHPDDRAAIALVATIDELFVIDASNPTTRSFWMTPKRSSIVILNLIAKLPFPYYKPEKPALIRID
jgi:hypothetical protein